MQDAQKPSVWSITAIPYGATLCGVTWAAEDVVMPRWIQALLNGLAAFARTMGPRRWPGQTF